MKLLNTLLEGGNVFKDKQGQPLTQRINQADVPATIAYLEKVLGMDFPEERWLGSTGRKPTSGDLDLAVDLSEINKDQLAAKLTQFVQNQKQDPREWVKKAGEVHFRTPIAGDPNKGYVQTDFMFFSCHKRIGQGRPRPQVCGQGPAGPCVHKRKLKKC